MMEKKNELFNLKVNAKKEEATVVLLVCKGEKTNALLHGSVFELQVAISTIANDMVKAFIQRGLDEDEAWMRINQGIEAVRIKRAIDKLMEQMKEVTDGKL